jgi:hypothetical protein
LEAKMQKMSEFASEAGFTALRDAIATFKIHDLYRRTGGKFGPLGISLESPAREADGSYNADYQLGKITLTDIPAQPSAVTFYDADVTLAAVKCFGTQDSDGNDSTYAVISLISLNPNNGGNDSIATTFRTEIRDDTHAGDVIFKARSIPPRCLRSLEVV